MGRLDGKSAIITGAARGMGEAEARLFASEGARGSSAMCLTTWVRPLPLT
jgi:NAD(P)-dependent dehydrogenase (short-subunit alcohol dehydrogenase family)